MKLILLALLLLAVVLCIQADDVPVCVGRNVISQPVREYCDNNNGTLRLRCCFTSDFSTIIAVDFMKMDLTSIPNLTNHSNLIPNVVDFRLNDWIVPSGDDFVGSTDLGTLYLPPSYPCPGGEAIWNITETVTDPAGNLCSGLKDSCLNASGVCTEPHSYCSTNGPNHTLCLCEGNYHGYKCLRNGNFPLAAFLGPTIGVAVALTIPLYWFTRRNVRKRRD